MPKQNGATIFWQDSPVANPAATNAQEAVGLPQLAQDASIVLYTLTAVFPFDLFPDKLIIRLNHIDILHGIFFLSGTTNRIQIIDIRDVSMQFSPFFATLVITPAGASDQGFTIRYLWKYQALRAKRILVGIIECHRQQVNLSTYSKNELLLYVEKIGKSRE